LTRNSRPSNLISQLTEEIKESIDEENDNQIVENRNEENKSIKHQTLEQRRKKFHDAMKNNYSYKLMLMENPDIVRYSIK